MTGTGRRRRRGAGMVLAAVLAPWPMTAVGHGAVGPGGVPAAGAGARIVPLSVPSPVHHASARPWARLAGRGGLWVWCAGDGRRGLSVTVPGGRSRRCAGVRVTAPGGGGRRVTWFAVGHGSFWARPLGASRGVSVRALGARGVFRYVTLAVREGRLVAVAGAGAPGAQARYHLTVSGRRTVRMTATEVASYRDRAVARRDRPALAGFYDFGVGTAMSAMAIDPARHDADGLWFTDARGPSWAPLRNPRHPWRQAYGPGVRAFGLLQRDRARRYYGVHAARPQDVPDVIVHWPGRGTRVVLRERPTAGRTAPNAWVMFGPRAQDRETLRYRLTWTRTARDRGDRAIVVSTLMGGNARSGARMYVIDYAGGAIARRLPDHALAGNVRVHPDTFVTQDSVRYNPYTHGYRQVLQVLPMAGRNIHVRAWLSVSGQRLSETWRYTLFAPRIAR